jgi:signal transduction histidine kinase
VNGPGISNDFIDVMYEPFTQVSGTKDGSGLGLAITKELIDVMGGYIEASSEPDGGTTFAVFLRAAS